ncbi:MAG: response regulator [Melioribacteraceae bacterium]|nr:response regulator [Melioribacteraceae bacterium]
MPDITNILLVEDEALTAMYLKMVLSKAGYKVFSVVATGEDALNAIVHTTPDLVLMDISLAGEMDGIDTAISIKQKVEVPIVFMSGYQDKQHIERANTVDPVKYMIKPIETPDLLYVINKIKTNHS